MLGLFLKTNTLDSISVEQQNSIFSQFVTVQVSNGVAPADWLLIRTHLVTCKQLPFCCFLTWQRERELKCLLSSYKGVSPLG